MLDYTCLQRDACTHRHTIAEAILYLRKRPADEPPMCPIHIWFMGAALLSFNFDYRHLILWLGGKYTNDHRNWSALEAKVADAVQVPTLP